MPGLAAATQHHTGSPKHSSQTTEIEDIQNEKEEVKLFQFTDDKILYVKTLTLKIAHVQVYTCMNIIN